MNLSTSMQSAKASVCFLAVEISLDSTQATNEVSQAVVQAKIKLNHDNHCSCEMLLHEIICIEIKKISLSHKQ